MNEVQNESEYTDEEFYEEFIKDKHKPYKRKLLSQRMPDKELIARVARECRYQKHEVADVLKGLWDVINEQFEQGREINFGGMFIGRLYKPHPRRLYDNKIDDFRMTDPRPKLKLAPTSAYQKYLWYGIHCPVNYFPPERVRNQDSTREEFTAIHTSAYFKWKEEEDKRKAKIVLESTTPSTEKEKI